MKFFTDEPHKNFYKHSCRFVCKPVHHHPSPKPTASRNESHAQLAPVFSLPFSMFAIRLAKARVEKVSCRFSAAGFTFAKKSTFDQLCDSTSDSR
mmetsp:Transcript_28311/g.71849  ORF Transcript_28311/g.71849 Transcript_28311/m.71849 type:complete len:95 (-) Transcript_28311:4315-4599(-)